MSYFYVYQSDMALGLSVCWRGPPGSGKRQALQGQLQLWAKSIGQVFSLKHLNWDAPLQGGETSEDDGEDSAAVAEKALLPMESSILHWGFDCARMSLKDKEYIKSILLRWGRGSQVLANGHNQRCLVFYHAHLLSSESVIFLQAFLEENYKDTVLWLTSEFPLPPRLADWCVEIPVVSQVDHSFQILASSTIPTHLKSILPIEVEIGLLCELWMKTPLKLSDVKQIRGVVYAMLHRNIRWVEGFHQWLFALDRLPLTPSQRVAVAKLCSSQPFTGPGQTVPSYRIPILWENYLCNLRNLLAPVAGPAAAAPAIATKRS